jgi:hypothetical protein
MIKSLGSPDYYSKRLFVSMLFICYYMFIIVIKLIKKSITQFGVSINVWRLAGDTLNITCNLMYFNHQVHRDLLITLYNSECSAWCDTITNTNNYIL